MVAGLLPTVIDEMRTRYPRLTIHVTPLLTSPDVYELSASAPSISSLGEFSRTHEKDFDVEILFDDPQFIVAGARSRWVNRRKIALADLLDEPWVLPDPKPRSDRSSPRSFKPVGWTFRLPASPPGLARDRGKFRL